MAIIKKPAAKGSGHRDQLNIRISDLGQEILLRLQMHYGQSKTSVIELLLREEARRLNMLTAPPPLKTDLSNKIG